jgi:NAD-dependent deacetylase
LGAGRKHIVVLTGAGISAESGLPTFRDNDGLWKTHDVYKLASPEGWNEDFKLVLDFYNFRRNKVREAQPNLAHFLLAELESAFDVDIITQNIDNLHERAGSKKVLHLHGEIMKAQSSSDSSFVYDLGNRDILPGDTCEKGSQLRPFVVWFGEAVPLLADGIEIVRSSDIFMVIGTSMVVYPAAGLIDYVPSNAEVIVIDKKIPQFGQRKNLMLVEDTAVKGVGLVVNKLLKKDYREKYNCKEKMASKNSTGSGSN